MSIRFKCPSCGNEIAVRSADEGKKGRCSQCNELVTIPYAGEQPESDSPATNETPPSPPQDDKTEDG